MPPVHMRKKTFPKEAFPHRGTAGICTRFSAAQRRDPTTIDDSPMIHGEITVAKMPLKLSKFAQYINTNGHVDSGRWYEQQRTSLPFIADYPVFKSIVVYRNKQSRIFLDFFNEILRTRVDDVRTMLQGKDIPAFLRSSSSCSLFLKRIGK